MLRDELETLKTKYANLLHTAKEHEQMAAKAAREGASFILCPSSVVVVVVVVVVVIVVIVVVVYSLLS